MDAWSSGLQEAEAKQTVLLMILVRMDLVKCYLIRTLIKNIKLLVLFTLLNLHRFVSVLHKSLIILLNRQQDSNILQSITLLKLAKEVYFTLKLLIILDVGSKNNKYCNMQNIETGFCTCMISTNRDIWCMLYVHIVCTACANSHIKLST